MSEAALGSAASHALVASDAAALLAAARASGDRVQLNRVFQGTGATIIRIAFSAGQEMREHSTSSPIVVQVLSGTIRFRVAGDELEMPQGAIVHVEPSVPHSLEADGEAHVLLTLCTNVAPTPVAAPVVRPEA